MIIYKYIEDFYMEDPQEEEFCKEHNIVYFKPTPKLKSWLENWLIENENKLPIIECEPDVVCYWRYFGVWGMYHPEDSSISVCPYKIENYPDGLEGVIRHELDHLKHPEADKLPHKDKENYINKA